MAVSVQTHRRASVACTLGELLPRFHRFQQQPEDERAIAKAILEGEAADIPTRTAAGGTAAGDPRRLRGLPAIGRNVSGATIHTDPVRALLAKERRSQR